MRRYAFLRVGRPPWETLDQDERQRIAEWLTSHGPVDVTEAQIAGDGLTVRHLVHGDDGQPTITRCGQHPAGALPKDCGCGLVTDTRTVPIRTPPPDCWPPPV